MTVDSSVRRDRFTATTAVSACGDRRLYNYLETVGIKSYGVEPLSGGITNQLWRVYIEVAGTNRAVGPGPYSTASARSVIVKHAEPFVFANPEIPFSIDRMFFEAGALELISKEPLVCTEELRVRTPVMYHHDHHQHCLMKSDGGSITLKAAYNTLAESTITDFGGRLGRWLANLDQASRSWDIGPQGNVTAKQIYRYSYQNLSQAMHLWGFGVESPGLADTINEKYGSLLQDDNDCVCMGDFWPGNIVGGQVAGAADEQRPTALTVVDWEMVRRGCGATDVGQLLAEAVLLNRFHGSNGKTLAQPFLHAYMQESERLTGDGPPVKFVNRVHVHCGVHLVFWPSVVRWAPFEETKEMARIGAQVLNEASTHGEAISRTLSQFLKRRKG